MANSEETEITDKTLGFNPCARVRERGHTRFDSPCVRKNVFFHDIRFLRLTFRAVRENSAVFIPTPMEIPKTDLQKVISYLNDACKLYEALPMQSMKSRAHMIRQLTNKLKIKIQQ